MNSQHMIHLGAWLPALVIIATLSLAFEVWMIVSAIRNENISENAKALWVIGMLIVHPIVAIVYYFTEHRNQ